MYLGVNGSISVINDVRMLTKSGHLHSSGDTSLDLGLRASSPGDSLLCDNVFN